MQRACLIAAPCFWLAIGLAQAQDAGGAAAGTPAPGVPAPAQPIGVPPVQPPVITNQPPAQAPAAPRAQPAAAPAAVVPAPATAKPAAPTEPSPQFPGAPRAQPGAAPAVLAPVPDAAKPGAPGQTPAEQAAQPRQPSTFVDLVERNEFQNFVAQTAGRLLPLFGYNLFRAAPTTFAPVENIPVTPDYIIGPGDELLVRAWGQIEIDYRAIVDRNGMIHLPRVGPVAVAGIAYKDITQHIRAAVSRNFRNFELMVTMGQLRSVQIFVVGQAARPGSYTVSALSTLVNAVFASGGPSLHGSMRRIQLKRAGRTVTEFDMYDLLVHGDKSKDVKLLPGDVLYYPPIGPLAAISGSVKSEAIFELKDPTSFEELIRLAGGFTTTAQTQKALVERIADRRVRRVEELTLDAVGLARRVQDGDVITIASITPRFDNSVRLQGNVAAPARYPWKNGMRVTDLLVDENALITRAFWQRQNEGVIVPRYTQREINFDYATLQRFDPKDLSSRLYAFNLGKAILGDVAENLELRPGDIVTIYSFDEPLPKTENDVVLQGGIIGLPPRRFPWRAGMRLRDLIPDQKWLVEYYGYWLTAGGASGRTEINWDYATVARLKPDDLTRTLLPVNLGKAILEQSPEHNVVLQPGDEVTIYSKADVAVPAHRRAIYVRLEGEVNHAGTYQVRPGETLRDLIVRAGGVTPQAYLFGAEFTRESTRRIQEERLKKAIEQLELDVQRAAIARAQAALTKEDAEAAQREAALQQSVLGSLKAFRPTGRIALEVPETAKVADIPAIALEDGDRFHVPAAPSMVNVFGAVFAEGAFLYRPEKSVSDYLAQAGGPRRDADERGIFVLRADGSVVSRRQAGWLAGSVAGLRLMPGDAIVVPFELDRTPLARHLKDWTQILANFGIGIAALKVLRDW